MALTDKTIEYLMENKMNNSREWYQSHKADYRTFVFQPMADLVEELTPAMLAIDPELVTEPKVDKTISRIYRDTRFSHDKSLYREVMWCVFSRDKKRFNCPPGFVFEFSPYGFRYGCGWFSAPPQTMEAMRSLLLENDKSFRSARKAFNSQTVFRMEGDMYKRSRWADQPAELQQWLNRKGIAFLCGSDDFDLLFSDQLGKRLAEDFLLLKPVYDFFIKASSR